MAMLGDAKNRVEPEKYSQRDQEQQKNDRYGSANMTPEVIVKPPHLFEFNIPSQEWRDEHEGEKRRKRIAQGVRTYARS